MANIYKFVFLTTEQALASVLLKTKTFNKYVVFIEFTSVTSNSGKWY